MNTTPFSSSDIIELFNITLDAGALNDTNNTVTDVCIPPEDVPLAWVAPPVDAWACHKVKIIVLFVYYVVICIGLGEFLNLFCVIQLFYRTRAITPSARYVMMLQCTVNIIYLSINTVYKATALYLQRTFLPLPVEVFLGWLHLVYIFTSETALCSVSITRFMYIVFPMKAKQWFFSRSKSLIPAIIPICIGLVYSIPVSQDCCYRLYRFSGLAFAYVGPSAETQLLVSLIGGVLCVSVCVSLYTLTFMRIRANSRAVGDIANGSRNARKLKQEIRLTIPFVMTCGLWMFRALIFYSIYWAGPFPAYSGFNMCDEMVEQALMYIDPIVYIVTNAELRRLFLKLFGVNVKKGNDGGTLKTNVAKSHIFSMYGGVTVAE